MTHPLLAKKGASLLTHPHRKTGYFVLKTLLFVIYTCFLSRIVYFCSVKFIIIHFKNSRL